ncbi:hypothetical protein E4P39_12750 [Blastococcus sp. CT_GayMR19]|uniref:hypothetical protein n=1 Tax=Blastococcus sp. CT_GayMR19 TaxID=2559608 RepID=UPI0010749241|nr:hypothetical protein [Blastococcus sp. CT_GayMR19]TFV74360.1 hypothetical protein E4P39_12750 [Blastococcus sp. CT_GayMR19]
MRHRRRLAAGLAVALCVLTGCTAGDPAAGPPVVAAPTADAPRGPGPLTTLLGAVDLSPAVPGVPTTAAAAVGAPDGGAFVLLSPPDPAVPHYLATVARTGSGYAVTGSVPVPRLRPIWDLHALADGTALVSGQFRGEEPGYGFLSVDPAGGEVRATVVIPFEDGTDLAFGSSVLSPDGETVTLFLSSFVDGRRLDLLMSAATSDGRILGGRDLFEEVRAVSESGIGPWSTWLFARPDGGVTVVFDAYPPGAGILGVPTAVRYDELLEPVGGPVALTREAASAQLRAVAGAPDGTVFARVEAQARNWLLALAPRGSSGTQLLDLGGQDADDAIVVDPALGWVLLPAAGGARAVDLATGGSTPVDLGCPVEVTQLLPGRGAASALILGRCSTPDGGHPTLWVLAAAQ